MQMPDVWGGGAVFGCAGSADSGLHGRLCGDRIAVEFDEKNKCTLAVEIDNICDIKFRTVLPDCIELEADDGSRKYDVSITALTPAGILVHCDKDIGVSVAFADEVQDASCDGGNVYCTGAAKYALIKKQLQSGVVYAFAAGDDCEAQAAGLCGAERADACGKIKDRYAAHPLPRNMSEIYEALYVRCLGIIEHNVSSSGCMGKRINGKFCVDTVNSLLCAAALKDIYPQYARATLLKIADYISADGFLPSSITQSCCANAAPPVICYCFEQIAGKDKELIEQYYDKLRSCIMYYVQGRDMNKNYVYQWRAGRDNDPGVESTMLNSPRFDGKVIVAGPDLSAYMYMAAVAMGKLSRAINRNSDILYWGVLAQRIADGANNLLYDKKHSFYFDRSPIGNKLGSIKTTAGFMPLYAGFAADEYVSGIVAHLEDRSTFGTNRGVPSAAKDEPAFEQDLYRGSIVLAENYKILQGLVNYDLEQNAALLASKCLDTVRRAYMAEGVLYEFYSSSATVAHSRQTRLGKSISPMCRTAFEQTRDCPVTAAFVVGIGALLD
ncbi:MAG: hypothetical protein IJ365_01510 [Clostridia bacterium]|nr:hypothetical protein [Clostridia bacterium]